MNELENKVALITGASKGIGAGIAKTFGLAGARVAVGYGSDREGAERVAAEINAAGGQAMAVRGDLSRVQEIEAMVAGTVEAFGPLDVLVNNAAAYEFKTLAEMDEAHFQHVFTPNVLGLLMVTKAAVARFNKAGGSIINISSLAAVGNAPASTVYSASKAAVNAITKVLALELAERKIRVNAIMPGYFDTEGARAVGMRGSELEARILAATPLEKRAGRASDLSPVVLFLASQAAAWMTGDILTVSGGYR